VVPGGAARWPGSGRARPGAGLLARRISCQVAGCRGTAGHAAAGPHVVAATQLIWAAVREVGGWGDGWAAAPAGARPQGRHGVYGGGYRVGGLLVVDPTAGEICPRVGGVAFDGKVDLAHPADRVEELLVAQAVSWLGSGSSGTSRPIARAIWLKHKTPRAGTGARGPPARNSGTVPGTAGDLVPGGPEPVFSVFVHCRRSARSCSASGVGWRWLLAITGG